MLQTKDQPANNVKEQLSRQLSSFGYAIRNCLVTDLNPDPRVKEKMNEINAAQRLRVGATDKAEAENIMIVKVRLFLPGELVIAAGITGGSTVSRPPHDPEDSRSAHFFASLWMH
ncbi:hypothetical protein CYMTET_8238 [Cymbomonas tetramitiformis]|uniref:Uncharacterized protein n=1 Tax=Cymbomonas tetramitiformis TaxID=36881 RepID=A0AAE0LGP8_9CHLO|nr:hypothetical protein CYMTET_8238 [Cymbomonas tetramitiformis]